MRSFKLVLPLVLAALVGGCASGTTERVTERVIVEKPEVVRERVIVDRPESTYLYKERSYSTTPVAPLEQKTYEYREYVH